MKKTILMMIMLLAVVFTCSNSYARSSVEQVKVENAKVIYLPDGTPQTIPAQYVKCVYPSGGVAAGSCDWVGYNNKYYPVEATTCDDNNDDVYTIPVRRGPWQLN